MSDEKVYAWYSSTDCDQMHVEYALEFDNMNAFREAEEDMHYNAEGPCYLHQLTKAEYDEAKDQSVRRDYAAEAAGY